MLLYHGGLAALPGGFLGVEVFFVISGYLITALLLSERLRTGRIDLPRFWWRRARRLLPALFLVLFVTGAYAVVFLPEEVAGLRADVLAALGYVTNWYLVLGQESYFEAVGRPSLLKHLWSLAVEEQFYLIWPPVLALGLSLGARRWRHRRMLTLALAGAAASALLMAVLYDPATDPSRLYYGTDTRAAGLLVGAALAFVWRPGMDTGTEDRRESVRRRLQRSGVLGRIRRRWGWTAPLLLDLGGLLALGALSWACLRVGEYDPSLYRGGFALVALATAGLIAAAAHPHTRLGGLLGYGPLRWVGLRSYGIYLWHWPVFMVTRPQLDVPLDGAPLLALRLAITILLADLSYRLVESPIRRGALERAWQTTRRARGYRRRRLAAGWAGSVSLGLAVCALLGVAMAQAHDPKPPSYLDREDIRIEAPESPAKEPKTTRAEEERPAEERKTQSDRERDTVPAASGPATAIGDSVMLGAAKRLEKEVPSLDVLDAQSGMQVEQAIEILRQRRAAGQLGETVVVHVGNNGPITEEQLDELLGVLEDVPRVVLVNVTVPRPWEEPNNELLAEAAKRRQNVVLADWHAASASRPGLFWDGMHLRPQGQKVYADVVSSSLVLQL